VRCPQCSRWLPRTSEFHFCVTPTEAEVMEELPEELAEAWERLREVASELGPQRIYASAKAVMFARRVCYCFVRAKRAALEVCIFLPETVAHPWIRSVKAASKTRLAHTVHVQHADQVGAPLTEWLRRAWEESG